MSVGRGGQKGSWPVVGFKFLRTDSLTPGLIYNRFLHYHSLQKQTNAGWHDISAKVGVCVASWCSLVREIIDFTYFLKF